MNGCNFISRRGMATSNLGRSSSKEQFLAAHQPVAAHSISLWRHTGTSPELSTRHYATSFLMVVLPMGAPQGGERTEGVLGRQG
jgi:hypothetical protein